jgi:hypothetical protein
MNTMVRPLALDVIKPECLTFHCNLRSIDLSAGGGRTAVACRPKSFEIHLEDV